MTLGPNTRQWRELRRRLVILAEECGAQNACVLDAWGNLWCSGYVADWSEQSRAITAVERALAQLHRPLQRGRRLDGRLLHGGEHLYVRSFANVYLTLLRFPGSFAEDPVRDAVAKALPGIEALTIALPPPSGPGSASGAGFGVA